MWIQGNRVCFILKKTLCLGLIFFVFGCSGESEYHQLLERELAKEVRQDSLFLGIKLGMDQREFFDHCWELNQQQIIKQGGEEILVEYKMKEGLAQPVVMKFFPEFYKDKIYQVPVSFTYEAWAPWNKSLFSDKLQLDLLRFFEKKYGKGFIKVEHPKRGIAYVKVDSNRRISIYKKNDSDVAVLFTDMIVDQELSR